MWFTFCSPRFVCPPRPERKAARRAAQPGAPSACGGAGGHDWPAGAGEGGARGSPSYGLRLLSTSGEGARRWLTATVSWSMHLNHGRLYNMSAPQVVGITNNRRRKRRYTAERVSALAESGCDGALTTTLCGC
eukprot:1056426-Pyramimonas_sp.AAC.1